MQLPIVAPAPVVTAHAEAVGGSGVGDAASAAGSGGVVLGVTSSAGVLVRLQAIRKKPNPTANNRVNLFIISGSKVLLASIPIRFAQVN